jgi:hypothetical protein
VHLIVGKDVLSLVGADGDEVGGLTVIDPNAVQTTEAFGLVFHC